MANQFIMAIGLNYTVNDKEQERELPSVEAVLHTFIPSLVLSKIEKNKAILTFDNYDDTEELIKEIYKHCSDINRPFIKEKSYVSISL